MSFLKAKLRALALASIGLAAATAARAEDLVVTHYASLLYGTPYAVGLDKGYFKEAGVDVTGILTSKRRHQRAQHDGRRHAVRRSGPCPC